MTPRPLSRLLTPDPSWLATCCLVLGAVAVPTFMATPAARAQGASTLSRPLFDRDNNVVLIPFQGNVPRFTSETDDNGTRLVTTFQGVRANPDAPYKLGIFHPLVSRVEMLPSPDIGLVKVSIWLTQPGSINVIPDTRRGVMRLQLGPPHLDAPVDLSVPVGPQPIGLLPSAVTAPHVHTGESNIVQVTPQTPQYAPQYAQQPQVAIAPVAPVRYVAPPASMPTALPSAPPVGFGSNPGNPLPGTPSSGEYVYRKAVTAANGRDVTEVTVRTGNRTDVGLERNVDTDSILVSARPPGEAPVQRPDGWERPLPSEPWRQPVYRGESTFKPVVAIDTLVGFTLMSENAPKLGSNLSGAGSTLYGGELSLPVGNAWNVRLGAQTFAYTITSLQVPEAEMRRDEYFGNLAIEYLPIRRPWVLAIGPGYWARYINTKSNVLAPPDPSILFQPTMLWHGPSVVSRVYVPFGLDGLAFTADVEAAPYMFGLTDAVSTELGNMYGYQLAAGLKYSTRHFSATAGYRQQGYGTFNGDLTANRGGPELSAVWRF